uniref:Uncharacterized protein n=1 Tax=viral metagenome TaxID=1070528 RepID=A0A6M3L2Y8_9ZZZZ
MELSIGERLVLLSVLPAEGTFVTMKVIRELQSNLGFSEEELRDYNVRQEEGKVFWDAANDALKQKGVEIGPKAKDIIVLALSKLSEEKKLRMEHIPLYEKFIEE